jgi:hypothetical protein
MTSIPTISDGSQPRQWSISNRTLVVSAGGERVLAVLNGRESCASRPNQSRDCTLFCHASTTRRSGRGTCGRCRASYRSRVAYAPVTANASTRYETSGLHQMPAELDADFRTPRQKQLARRLRTVT